ncbi:MAG: PEP-CTERM-box response regulator transcription factor [Akkermansiaceae bacterium]|nr:PEP-CTERM-box response regulator transcription factor [Akkermansiaceae bacterium]
MKPSILIVDDGEGIRTQMIGALGNDYEILLAEDRLSALEQFKAGRPAVTLLDLGLPPNPHLPDEGMQTLSGILSLDRFARVIVVSGQEERDNAVRAVGAGASDFHCKPVNVEKLQFLLQRCIYVANLEREHREGQEQGEETCFEGMIGKSPAMRELFTTVRKVADSNVPVLILGESGTGKEMVARAIHRRSYLASRPFIAINCSAIPEHLLESELFGHEKGAFTGALTRREGLIASASGGTLFLDEVGALPAPVQVKLLRFLQDNRVQRVGGRSKVEVETRILAATNSDLEEQVREGTFREDLYFRLAVVVCRVPPLRERGEDVVLLAQDFLQRFAEQIRASGLMFAPQTLDAVRVARWRGNIRELQNRVQRAVIMAEGKRITIEDMELADLAAQAAPLTLRKAREKVERELVERALRRHGGKVTAAAAALEISRPTLYELMNKLGIEREKSRRC